MVLKKWKKLRGWPQKGGARFLWDSWPIEKVPPSPPSFPPPDRKKELVVAKKVGMVSF